MMRGCPTRKNWRNTESLPISQSARDFGSTTRCRQHGNKNENLRAMATRLPRRQNPSGGFRNAITGPEWTHLDQDTDPFGKSFSEVAAWQPDMWHVFCCRLPKKIKYNKSNYIKLSLKNTRIMPTSEPISPLYQSKENRWVQFLPLGGSILIRW